MVAAFEEMWFARLRAIMLDGAAALAIVVRLCGDEDTVQALTAGDRAALHQLGDAFAAITSVRDRLAELGPTPERLAALGAITLRAFEAFAEAGHEFTNATTDGVDPAGIARMSRHVRDGNAVLDELSTRPELVADPADAPSIR